MELGSGFLGYVTTSRPEKRQSYGKKKSVVQRDFSRGPCRDHHF
jgi:hypothetical protein